MRTRILLLSFTAAIAFAAPAAAQNKPPKPPKPGASAVSLNTTPGTVVFGSVATLSGAVTGNGGGGVTIRLEQDTTRPYGDSYKPAGITATTGNNGKYEIKLKPTLNTQYRVTAQASPTVTSNSKIVFVRMRVGLKVSDSTPRAGSLVKFSGSVFPAHDGATVSLQRRSATGRFVTVKRTKLRDAGTARSTYSARIRIRRDGVYRVRIAGDGDHIGGVSRRQAINAG